MMSTFKGAFHNRSFCGFTLIELLAVIVILAIIAIITVPMVLGSIDKAKLGAFRISAQNTLDAAELYEALHEKITSEGLNIQLLDLKHKENYQGMLFKTEEQDYVLKNFTDGTYCANGTKTELTITKENCIGEQKEPTITKVEVVKKTTKSIQVKVSAEDSVAITRYGYCIESCEEEANWQYGTEPDYTFDHLTHGTTYTIHVRVKNLIGFESEKEITERTETLPSPTYQVSPSGWSKSKTVTVTYPEGYQNYYQVTEGTVKENGTAVTVGEEKVVSGTTATLTFESNGRMIAKTTDGYNEITVSDLVISQVDNEIPTINFLVDSFQKGEGNWYHSFKMNVISNDQQSGIAHVKYCITETLNCIPNIEATLNNNTITFDFNSNSKEQRICAQGIDYASNQSEIQCSPAYFVDQVDPIAKISATVHDNSIRIDASASSDSDSGIATYYYSKDGINFITSNERTYTFSNLEDGTYTLYVKVVDRSGRMSSTVSTRLSVLYKNLKVNILSGPGGTASGYSKINKNGTVSFPISPASGYSVSSVTCTNSQRGIINGNMVVISSVTQDTICVVSFVKTITTSTTEVVVQTGLQRNSSLTMTCGDHLNLKIGTDGPDVGYINLAVYHPSGSLLHSWSVKPPTWNSNYLIHTVTAAGNYRVTHYAKSYDRTVAATATVKLNHSYTIFQKFSKVPTCTSQGIAIFKCRSCSNTTSITVPAIACN